LLLLEIPMVKQVLAVLAMAGIYVWIRRQQQNLAPVAKPEHTAEADWANEGGANPAPAV